MLQALQISFQDLPPSPTVEAHVRAKVERLEAHFRRLISCRITLGETSRNPNPRANSFFCHIDVRVPGREIAVGRTRGARAGGLYDGHPPKRKSLAIAIRDAFDGAERALREYSQIRRGR